jgi:hypothetical protein
VQGASAVVSTVTRNAELIRSDALVVRGHAGDNLPIFAILAHFAVEFPSQFFHYK